MPARQWIASVKSGVGAMKKLTAILYLSLALMAGPTSASAADDRIIEGALVDIQKYEQQFAGTAPVNKAAINRTLKLLTLTRQRLDSAADHSQPAWQAADTRYNALVAHLNNLANPAGATTTASPPQKTAPPAPATPSSMPPAETTATGTTTGSAPAQQMISHQRVQVNKLDRDIKSATATVDKDGPKPFQDPQYVQKIDNALTRFRDTYAKFTEFKGDPDVDKAASSLATFENMIAFGKDLAAKELASLGDVQARLNETEGQMRQVGAPQAPMQPFEKGQLEAWLRSLAANRKAAIAIYQPLPEIRERAYLPNNPGTVEQGAPYDMQDVDRIERYLRDTVSQIDASLKEFTEQLSNAVRTETDSLSFYESFDPADPETQAQQFLGAGRADDIRQQLAKKHLLVSEAAEYSRLLKHDTLDERLALLSRIENVSKGYEESRLKALELVRMPKAVTTDTKLQDTAMKTLQSYDYVGEIKRLVINTEKTHRKMETSEAEFDKIDVGAGGKVTLSGTQTTYYYEWDEFQVATAEPIEDTHYIFYTTLKYYTSGAAKTPLNRWIISNRIQGSEIPLANIELD